MKPCIACHEIKALDEFYVHPEMGDGHLNKCKECVKAYMAARRAAGGCIESDARRENSERRKEWRERWYSRDHRWTRISKWAASRVSNAVRRGLLVKAERCEECNSETFIEAAHSDYSQPLMVRWLCRRCHRRWDAKEPKTVALS